MRFGQVVVGPPGSGKTSYCLAMRDFLCNAGRATALVNLDPANELSPAMAAGRGFDVDVRELVDLEEVMERLALGPNGALLYCIEFLHQNLDWLIAQLRSLTSSYIIFDCPGQVELYTHHQAVRDMLHTLEQQHGTRLCVVHLLDSHHCTDPGKFVSGVLTALSTMLQLEMPHINVLSKVDLVDTFDQLPFRLDFYTDVLDLTYLLEALDEDPIFGTFKSLNKALVELIQDFELVQFAPLNLQDEAMMRDVTALVDKASGYIFSGMEEKTYDLRPAPEQS